MSSVSPMRSMRSMKDYADSTNAGSGRSSPTCWPSCGSCSVSRPVERLQRDPRGAPSGRQPVVGDSIAVSMSGASGQTLADAGTSLGMTIDEFSRTAGLFVALVPIIIVVGP